MTNFLVKIFIKNHENTEHADVRTSYGVLASIIGILCNLLLFATKLTIGLLINSISIQADAVNNLSDAGSSIVSLIGVKLAERPADKEHPFGHGRMEYISALIVAFLILLVGISLFKESFVKILHPEKVGFNWIMVTILILSICVKIWLSLFYNNIGKRINSSVLRATAADSRNDVIVTSVTILSVVIGKVTGFTVDGWMGLLVSVFVLLSGFNIAKDTLMPLLGEAVDKDVNEKIKDKVESYDGIIGSHDLIVHNYGPSHIMATIHVEVSNENNIEEIHTIIDQIERDILHEMGIFIVIHMDPVEMNDEKILECKSMVLNITKQIETQADIHDFRIENTCDKIKLIFDLVVPYSYSKTDEQVLLDTIIERISKLDSKYQCIITIENSFIAE